MSCFRRQQISGLVTSSFRDDHHAFPISVFVSLFFSMVGHKFIEALKEKDPSNKFNVVTFCEENRAAYNRMRLTEVRSLHPKLFFFFLIFHVFRSLAAGSCDQTNGAGAQPKE